MTVQIVATCYYGKMSFLNFELSTPCYYGETSFKVYNLAKQKSSVAIGMILSILVTKNARS